MLLSIRYRGSLRIQPCLLAPRRQGRFAGEASAPQPQKLHTDDVKSVRNLFMRNVPSGEER